jgi:hypothetical protein
MVILIARQHWDPIKTHTSKAIGQSFNFIGYFLSPHQKECSRNRPVETTSAQTQTVFFRLKILKWIFRDRDWNIFKNFRK